MFKVLPVVTTVPAVLVKVPVSYLTVVPNVRVPAVFIVTLFLSTPVLVCDHVPVPLKTIAVVPVAVAVPL